VAALNSPDWAGSAWCGACADVTGPSGSVRIRIVDLCPECASGDLDLSPEAFQQLAAVELGRVPITWRLVTCDVAGPVSYRYKDGANQWWTAVQVLNHRVPVQSMEYSKDGTTWSAMVRQEYNYFLTESGFGEGTTRVRITSVDGQVWRTSYPPCRSTSSSRAARSSGEGRALSPPSASHLFLGTGPRRQPGRTSRATRGPCRSGSSNTSLRARCSPGGCWNKGPYTGRAEAGRGTAPAGRHRRPSSVNRDVAFHFEATRRPRCGVPRPSPVRSCRDSAGCHPRQRSAYCRLW
jgi:hypothetical protein